MTARVTHGREHRYVALGFPYQGRMARTHWDEQGRATIVTATATAAFRLRERRLLLALIARLDAKRAAGA